MAWGIRPVELAAVMTAAVAMAGASAFAVHAVLGAAAALLAGPAALLAVAGLLVRIDAAPHALPQFQLERMAAFDGAAELLLTEIVALNEQELLLDDALEEPAADARVVRLFDVQARPAAAPAPDASDALRQALSDLRRSLR